MACTQSGSQQYFGIAKEGTRGTAEAVPVITLPVVTNPTTKKHPEETKLSVMYQNRDNTYDVHDATSNVEGEVSLAVENGLLDYVLVHMFNVTSVQEATSGAWKNTYKPYNTNTSGELCNQPPTFTAFYSDNSVEANYYANGCVFDNPKIEAGQTETIITVTVKGRTETKATGGALTAILAAISYTEPSQRFLWSFLVIKDALPVTGTIMGTTLDASSNFINIEPSVTIAMENGSDFVYSTGSVPEAIKTPFDIRYKGQFSATVETGGSYVIDSSLKDTFSASTKMHYEFEFKTEGAEGVELGTASGLYPLLRIRVAECKPVVDESDRSLDNDVMYSFNLQNLKTRPEDGCSIELYHQSEIDASSL